MKLTSLSVAILCAASTQVLADKEYWIGTDGDYARGRDGKCVRTILWTQERSIDGCEGRETKAEVKPAPVKKEPVAAAVVAAPVAAAPKTETMSLSSDFELGGSTLSAAGKAEVAAMVAKFEGKTVDSVVVEGYTDDSGDAAYNQQLSEERAEAVKAELVANGANPDKISTVGHGEDNPIADNSTPEGREKNRRVEIKVEGVQPKQ
jgi:outer membrane protein OmpA-like peptidoglycan-associated protein